MTSISSIAQRPHAWDYLNLEYIVLTVIVILDIYHTCTN